MRCAMQAHTYDLVKKFKTANKNVNRLTFVFERQQIHDGNKKKKRMCLNGVNCREIHQVKKKVKELQYAHRSFSSLINKIIYYVYECFDQYCMLILRP